MAGISFSFRAHKRIFRIAPALKISALWAFVDYVYQPEYLPSGSAEIIMGAAAVTEVANSSFAQFLLIPGNVCRPEFDPGAPERMLIIHGVSRDVFGSQLTELDTEAAPVTK
jgi:hypothetical protein